MSTIRLSPGNIYQFGTAQNNNSYVAAINGTEIPIQKTFLNGIVLARGSSTGSIMYGSGSNFSDFGGTTLDNRGVFVNHGTEKIGQYHILTDTSVTMSSTNIYSSGSVYLVDTTSNSVSIQVPSNISISGSILKFVKVAGSNRFSIDPTINVNIGGALTQSTVSTYASIEVLATNSTTYDYAILSAFGTWT
jgi:hypothetical protein